MLRKTLSANDNVDISNFLNLKSMIKNNAKGYKPKKAFVLRWNQIMRFMTEALDHYIFKLGGNNYLHICFPIGTLPLMLGSI